MIAARLPTAMVLATLLTGSAFAADQERLGRRGYQELWQGVAAIPMCRHGQDRYNLGPYLFVCDQWTMDMPGYAGAVMLMGQNGSSIAYLCLNRDQDCIAGSISVQ